LILLSCTACLLASSAGVSYCLRIGHWAKQPRTPIGESSEAMTAAFKASNNMYLALLSALGGNKANNASSEHQSSRQLLCCVVAHTAVNRQVLHPCCCTYPAVMVDCDRRDVQLDHFKASAASGSVVQGCCQLMWHALACLCRPYLTHKVCQS